MGSPGLVRVESSDKDKYGHTLSDVFLGGTRVNLEMVKGGRAWVYRAFTKDKDLLNAEQKAWANRVGVWSDTNPTPSWEFRKQQ